MSSKRIPTGVYALGGVRLAIEFEGPGIQVWLNTEVARFDGLCVGAGDTYAEAVTDALRTLRAAVRTLEAYELSETADPEKPLIRKYFD